MADNQIIPHSSSQIQLNGEVAKLADLDEAWSKLIKDWSEMFSKASSSRFLLLYGNQKDHLLRLFVQRVGYCDEENIVFGDNI